LLELLFCHGANLSSNENSRQAPLRAVDTVLIPAFQDVNKGLFPMLYKSVFKVTWNTLLAKRKRWAIYVQEAVMKNPRSVDFMW